MDGATDESEARISAYVESLASVIGHANRVSPLKDYCIGLILPRRTQERRANGRSDRAHASERRTSIASALCRSVAMVRRGGVGEGARTGSACD